MSFDYRDDQIFSKLNNILNNYNSIDLNGPFFRPTDKYIKRLNPVREIRRHVFAHSREVVRYFKRIFSVISAYPERSDVKNASNNLFRLLPEPEIGPDCFANTDEGYFSFTNEIIGESTDSIILRGDKGSGKTFFLNCWLNKHSEEMLVHKLVWFRLDISLLHELNMDKSLKRHTGEIPYSLTDFLNVCIPYITFVFRQDYKPFEIIYEDSDNAFDKESMKNYAEIINEDKLNLISPRDKILSQFKRNVNIEEKLPDTWIELYDKVKSDITLLLADKRRIIDCEHLSYTIFHYLRKLGYRIFLVLDGVDNLDYYTQSSQYDSLVEQLCTIMDKCPRLNRTDKVFIAARNETISHMEECNSNFSQKRHKTYLIKDNNPILSLKYRHKYAYNKKYDYFTNRLERAKEAIMNDGRFMRRIARNKLEWGREFISSRKHISKTILQTSYEVCEILNKIVPENVIRDVNNDNNRGEFHVDDLFEILYNNNLRDFFFNCINISLYRRLAEDHHPFIAKKDYLVTEGLLLNGNLYLDSNSDKKIKYGTVIPNILYFNSSLLKPSDVWHGLCLIRLLQSLKHSSKTKEDLIEDITNKFGYNPESVNERLVYALMYGLIKSTYYLPQDKCLYSITNKGKLLMFYPFFDIDTFYYCCLDTFVPERILNNPLLIKSHYNREKDGRKILKSRYWGDFTEACVISSITLIRIIRKQHSLELSNLEGEDVSIFTLPDYFPRIPYNGLVKQLNRLKSLSKKRYNDLCSHIFDME